MRPLIPKQQLLVQKNLPLPLLGGLSIQEFLTTYWQKKPLLIRKAIPKFKLSFSGDHLAGVAIEEEATSRIVQELKNDQKGRCQWKVSHGPFTPQTFTQLPKKKWTLLVQETELWFPQVAKVKSQFRFIPDWRLDDVMISYAADKGSVGPHTDFYDVFLLQGSGKRRWLIESSPRKKDQFHLHLDIKILKDFSPDQDYVLSPGDMLYLPPRFAHHGIAIGNCMTLSIGQRAPSVMEMFSSHFEHLTGKWDEGLRYSDPDLKIQSHPAEITQETLEKIHSLFATLTLNQQSISRWFGKLVTTPKRGLPLSSLTSKSSSKEIRLLAETQLKSLFKSPGRLIKSEAARMAFIRQPGGGCLLFINGAELKTPPSWTPFIINLCHHSYLKVPDTLDLHQLRRDKNFRSLLTSLFAHQLLSFKIRPN